MVNNLNHNLITNGDARPRPIVAGADTPPSQWPEALTAGVRLGERLVALVADDS
jgi:hypothetical protein